MIEKEKMMNKILISTIVVAAAVVRAIMAKEAEVVAVEEAIAIAIT
jgi:hypothetical protein